MAEAVAESLHASLRPTTAGSRSFTTDPGSGRSSTNGSPSFNDLRKASPAAPLRPGTPSPGSMRRVLDSPDGTDTERYSAGERNSAGERRSRVSRRSNDTRESHSVEIEPSSRLSSSGARKVLKRQVTEQSKADTKESYGVASCASVLSTVGVDLVA